MNVLLILQVIAIENAKLFSPIKYHRSKKKMFKTYDPDYFEEESSMEEEVVGDGGVENMETEGRTSLNRDTRKKRKEKKKEKKDDLENNFFPVIVGGSLAGIFLLIIVVSVLVYLRGKLCQKTRVEEEESEHVPSPIMTRERSLSHHEQRSLSLESF